MFRISEHKAHRVLWYNLLRCKVPTFYITQLKGRCQCQCTYRPCLMDKFTLPRHIKWGLVRVRMLERFRPLNTRQTQHTLPTHPLTRLPPTLSLSPQTNIYPTSELSHLFQHLLPQPPHLLLVRRSLSFQGAQAISVLLFHITLLHYLLDRQIWLTQLRHLTKSIHLTSLTNFIHPTLHRRHQIS